MMYILCIVKFYFSFSFFRIVFYLRGEFGFCFVSIRLKCLHILTYLFPFLASTVPTFHTAHTRSRPRLEREREYDEYTERDYSGQTHLSSHLPGAEDYRERGIDRLPARDHRRDDEYQTHRGSSRRALNAI